MWNLPNMLTLGRLAVLPLVVTLIWPGIESRTTCVLAAVLYALAGIFDIIDGVIARHTNQVTVLGKFLDPLADKLFYLITLIALLQIDRVPPWAVMVILGRELAITGLRGIAVSEGIVIAAGEGGKAKTALANVGMCGFLIHYKYVVDVGFATAVIDCNRIGLWVTYLSMAYSLSSGWGYVTGFMRAQKALKAGVAR